MRIFLDGAIEPVWGRYPRLQAEARARAQVEAAQAEAAALRAQLQEAQTSPADSAFAPALAAPRAAPILQDNTALPGVPSEADAEDDIGTAAECSMNT